MMRTITSWLILTFCIVLLCLVKIPAALAQDSSLETLQQRQERLQKERSQVTEEKKRLSDVEKGAQRYLEGLQNNIKTTNQATKDFATALQQANQALQMLEKDQKIAQQSYTEKRQATAARLRLLQRSSLSIQGWDILLASKDLNEFFDRQARLELIYRADQRTLFKLRSQAEILNRQTQAIATQKNQIALLNQQLLGQKTQFQDQLKVQQEMIDRLNQDRTALEAADAQLQKDSNQIATIIQQRMQELAARQSIGTGRFKSPNDGELSSNFGWRIHPIWGYERFHAGVDFAADYGSNIRAADTGIVILADWYGGYGNTVVIDHGAGVSSLYGHASQLLVNVGQMVKQGEVIAAVGSTGLSTGPHLHFEVRESGEPVDPIKYLVK